MTAPTVVVAVVVAVVAAAPASSAEKKVIFRVNAPTVALAACLATTVVKKVTCLETALSLASLVDVTMVPCLQVSRLLVLVEKAILAQLAIKKELLKELKRLIPIIIGLQVEVVGNLSKHISRSHENKTPRNHDGA